MLLSTSSRKWLRAAAWILGLVVPAAIFVGAVHDRLPPKATGDFLCFWTAGNLLREGHSPYDPELQTSFQQELGWNKAQEGIGIYDYLPYFYPPWFGLLFVPLTPLSYGTAKAIWLAINLELLFLSGYLMRDLVKGLSPYLSIALVILFAPSLAAILFGQVSLLVLFLLAATWRLLEKGWDRWAGVMLAWVTIKPQLAVLLTVALLLWAVRQRRWGIVQGFGAMLLVLCLASSLIVPAWPVEMLRAIQRTPVPSEFKPWFSSTWIGMLRTILGEDPDHPLHRMQRAVVMVLYLAVAIPFLVALLRAALDRTRPVRHVLSLSLLAVFFVGTYARTYDFPVLVIPALVLMGDRIPHALERLLLAVSRPWAPTISAELADALNAVLLLVLMVLPYVHIASFPLDAPAQGYIFWIPLLLAVLWLVSAVLAARGPAHAEGAKGS